MFVRHALIYTVGEALSRVCKVFSLYLLADIQSKLEFGFYNYIVAAVGVILTFLDCGLNTLVIVRANGDRLQRLFKVFIAAKILLVLSVSAVVSIFASVPAISTVFPILDTVAVLLALSIGWDLSVFLASAHRANFDYSGEAVAKFLWSTVFVALLLAAKFSGLHITAVQAVLLQVLSSAVAIAWSLLRIGWRGVAILKIERRTFHQITVVLGIGLPFTITVALASLFSSVDLLMLGYFSKYEFLATFSVAHKFGLLMYLPLGIVQGFVMPYLSGFFGKNRRATSSDQLDPILLMTLSCAVSLSQFYILAVDWVIIPALGVEKYSEVAWIARIMALYIPLMYLHTILWTLLISMRFTAVANLPAAIITPILAGVDYVLVSWNYIELIVWSPVLANAMMLGGLVIVYRLSLGVQPISIKTVALGSFSIFLLLALSLVSPSDDLGFAAIRLFVALLAVMVAMGYITKIRREVARQN